MKEIIVKIKYSDTSYPFSAFDVQKAMENIFGLNIEFEVEQIKPETTDICQGPKLRHLRTAL
jgi:hypothetical protein